VLVSIELDQAIPWYAVPVPAWVVDLLWKWVRKLNAQVQLHQFFAGAPPNLFQSDGEVPVSHFNAPSGTPSIQLPLVSAANNMNVYPHLPHTRPGMLSG
jgi:hypothetical protein